MPAIAIRRLQKLVIVQNIAVNYVLFLDALRMPVPSQGYMLDIMNQSLHKNDSRTRPINFSTYHKKNPKNQNKRMNKNAEQLIILLLTNKKRTK